MTDGIQPKITIITVCYNEPVENVQLTFGNISSQAYSNKEWIVIDGGSKPETISEIRNYENAIDRFVSEPDNGIYDAMNKGVGLATGDFIIFMNTGDRFYSSETLNQIADYIDRHPEYDCYFGDAIFVHGDGREQEIRYDLQINRLTLYNTTVCHQATVARRSVFAKTGSFDTRYKIVADKDWAFRTLDSGARWIYTGITVCRFDITGCTANTEKVQREHTKLLIERYSLFERLCYRWAYRVFRRYQKLKLRIGKLLDGTVR